MTENNLILRELLKAIDAGRTVAVATIAKRTGSSPRDVGAKMLVFPDGTIVGTIGGGKFESCVIQDSLELFEQGGSGRSRQYRFGQEGPNAIGMTCGGEAEVFIEIFRSPRRLFIFGGGHIGKELARLAQGSNFLVNVIDDRPEMLDNFGSTVITGSCEENYRGGLPKVEVRDFVVIVTRSHESDFEVLRKYIGVECAYIGLMGSRAKINRLFDKLRESGIDEAQLEKVHAPIGKEIGAEGPWEIGISILAELVEVRHSRSQKSS